MKVWIKSKLLKYNKQMKNLLIFKLIMANNKKLINLMMIQIKIKIHYSNLNKIKDKIYRKTCNII